MKQKTGNNPVNHDIIGLLLKKRLIEKHNRDQTRGGIKNE